MDMPTITPELVLSIYAAALSTILGVNELRKSKTEVTVSCGRAIAGELHCAYIEALNSGHQTVTIVHAAIIFQKGNQMFQPLINSMGPWKLPAKLEDGDSVKVYIEAEEMKRRITDAGPTNRPKYAVATDSRNNTYRCEILDSFIKSFTE